MELFREVSLGWFWPVCVVLWTIIAAIGVAEHAFNHRAKVNKLLRRIESLERKERKKKE